MKLFLTSSTITKGLVNPFEKLVRKKITGLKVAFIPDAADGVPTENDKSWVVEERQFLVESYEWEITDFVLKKSSVDDIETLVNYDVIFVNGGFSGYLARVMRKSGFEKLLPKLLKQGVVYVGSSAGSMVMSNVQDASSWYINEPEPEAIDIPGLGYIDFQIYPHVKPGLVRKIVKRRNPSLDYYLLRDGHAISINNDIIKFCGNGIILLPKTRSETSR